MAPADWRILPTSKPNKPLLVQTDFGNTGYTVRVTDISSIWSETLDKDGLIARAREVESDINPEEDPSQMRILLDKIKDTLHYGDTSQIYVRTISERIELFLTIPLPGGLSDLQWTAQLEKQPASALQTHVVNPALALAFMQKQQIDDLTRKLEDKDSAISKLLDKVESMGLDFGTLFPTARLNRRLDQRKQIFQQVPGLAVFDKEKWRAKPERPDAEDTEPIAVLEEALKYSSSEVVYALAQRLPTVVEGRSTATARTRHGVAQPTHALLIKDDSHSQYDGFQRQATPEKQREPDAVSPSQNDTRDAEKRSKMLPSSPKGPTAAEDESTEDEVDLDSGFQRQPSPSRRSRPGAEPDLLTPAATAASDRLSPSPAKKRKLGGLRAKPNSAPDRTASMSPGPSVEEMIKQKEQSLNRTPSPPTSKPLPATAKGSEGRPSKTRSVFSSTTSTSEKPEPPPKRHPLPKKLGKLDKIGGKQAANADANADAPSHETSITPQPELDPKDVPMRDASEAPPTAKKKLGKIGARPASSKAPTPLALTTDPLPSREADDKDVAASIEPTNETPAPPSGQPAPRATPEVEETAEEKANRKRQALKQDLEAAKPAGKKKRRF